LVWATRYRYFKYDQYLYICVTKFWNIESGKLNKTRRIKKQIK